MVRSLTAYKARISHPGSFRVRLTPAVVFVLGALALLLTVFLAEDANASPSQASFSAVQSGVRDARDHVQQRHLEQRRSYKY
jgi:hypothetical protein